MLCCKMSDYQNFETIICFNVIAGMASMFGHSKKYDEALKYVRNINHSLLFFLAIKLHIKLQLTAS